MNKFTIIFVVAIAILLISLGYLAFSRGQSPVSHESPSNLPTLIFSNNSFNTNQMTVPFNSGGGELVLINNDEETLILTMKYSEKNTVEVSHIEIEPQVKQLIVLPYEGSYSIQHTDNGQTVNIQTQN